MNTRISAVLFGSAFAGAALLTLIESAAKGLAVFAIAAVVTLMLRRASAATRHLVWASALACALALPFCAWFLPQWQVLPTWMRWETIPRQFTAAAPVRIIPMTKAEPALFPTVSTPDDLSVERQLLPSSSRPLASAKLEVISRIRVDARAVLLVWLSGAMLLLGPLLYSWVKLGRVAARCRETSGGPLAGTMAELKRELGIRRPIRLLLGDAEAMPMVWGIFRPRLLLPSNATDWEASRLRGVLLHELAHLRRRDPLSILIAQLALAVHWFNPLAWFAMRQLRAEQERACDDYVLRYGVRASDYASDLLAVATGLRGMPFATAALTMAHPARLEGRIIGILDAARNRRALTGWLAVAVAVTAAAIALPLAMLRAEEEQKAPVVITERANAVPAAKMGSIAIAGDSAEITVDEAAGSLAIVVGEGSEERIIVHQFARSQAPILFRVSADDRKGKWWDQAKISRAGGAQSLIPVLRDDWLPAGRVVFLQEPAKRADGGMTIAEIETKTGRTPLAVRTATPRETSEAAELTLPRTCPETEIDVSAYIYALGENAPKKAVMLPVLAARDLVGLPQGRLGVPYVSVAPGVPQHWARMGDRVERLDVTAISTPGGVQLNGVVAVNLIDRKYDTPAEAWSHAEDASAAEWTAAPTRLLRAEFSAMLAGNDALVVPIPSEGLFPETLVASVTAQPRRLERAHWLPPSARSPIQVDGWVLTWPRSEHEWFASQFDYKGVPEMISHVLERRRDTKAEGIRSEGVGTLDRNQVDKLVGGFRGKTGVTAEGVEAFSVKPHLSSWSSPEDRTSFSAAGERGSLLIGIDERYISPSVRWESPVLKHVSGSVEYGMYSGSYLCALLPGPVDPENIRMLVLRCVDPDAKGAKVTTGTEVASSPKVASPPPQKSEQQFRGSLVDRNGIVLAESVVAGMRRYPLQTLAVHTLGFTANADRHLQLLEGRSGMEQVFNDALKKGKDVSLTLDAPLQTAVEKTLRGAGIGRGAVVIVDPATGELLAKGSVPSFDANPFVPAVAMEYWQELSHNPAKPFLDRAVSGYAPGSTFHLVTALAACRSGKADRVYDCDGSVTYGGKTFECVAAHGDGKSGHGRLNLRQALAESCDCYFYQLGNEIGIEAIAETARMLGLGRASALGLAWEDSGVVASPAVLKKFDPAAKWLSSHTANAAIGQGFMLASPVQMAGVVASIANGGRVLAPRLQTGGKVQSRSDLITKGVKAEHLAMLREVMSETVSTRDGVAAQARTSLISIAGRTGATLTNRKIGEISVSEPDEWFIGYAPADSPHYAFAVVVENSTGGGAAAIARHIMESVASGLPAPEAQPEEKGHLSPVGIIRFGAE